MDFITEHQIRKKTLKNPNQCLKLKKNKGTIKPTLLTQKIRNIRDQMNIETSICFCLQVSFSRYERYHGQCNKKDMIIVVTSETDKPAISLQTWKTFEKGQKN